MTYRVLEFCRNKMSVIYIYIYIYIYSQKDRQCALPVSMPFRLLSIRLQPYDNSCTWTNDAGLHVAGTSNIYGYTLFVQYICIHIVHYVPKRMSCKKCHKSIVMIGWSAHCFHDSQYIFTFIYIYIYIIYIIYIYIYTYMYILLI